MPLDAGSIDVSDPENVTGTGLAYEMFVAAMSAVPPENIALVAASMKPYFEGQATAIIDHFKNNGVITVVVHTTDAGLQRTPTPNNPGTATVGPAADQNLVGTIA